MDVRIFLQPFDVNGARFGLGNDLSAQLRSGNYNEVLIFSAYVTSSGTQRLGPALRTIIDAGGTVRAMIGVRNGLTSMQAVRDLHANGVEVWGLNTGGSVLYHPKIYALRGVGQGWVSMGSSNLTGDGLYRNFETNVILTLNPATAGDRRPWEDVTQWWNRFVAAYPQNATRIQPADVDRLVTTRVLADELALARRAGGTPRQPGRGGQAAGDYVPPIFVPGLPAVSGQRPVRRPARRGMPPAPQQASLPSPTPETRHFAMTLSAHDASKRTGMPGTPELSLPRQTADFFPPMALSGRQYPDAYFDVRLNEGQQARIVEYRIWERPAGAAVGHPDMRINIKHDTVDLTTPGGGDIILFEVTPEESGPAYDVWIVHANDPNFAALTQRCTHAVAAQGAAAVKRYGFF
jgi:hypothetical protein